MKQLGSYSKDFCEIWNLSIFRKLLRKFKIHYIRKIITCNLYEDNWKFLIISRSFPFRMRNVSEEICKGNQNARVVFSNVFQSRAFYHIMWKITAERSGLGWEYGAAHCLLDN